ncbi:ATP-dependent Clp protease adaptor ClpS [Tenacibaculum finnmarkense genomovar finnmarkense]|uniref:Clp protease ClpS n=2 Tax=Tenacibaculum TaxID=104267 RepID=A0A2I2M816_9FLAO|nr:ATP-dependent Clp protease adaptor ClpS [Tenacibaculum finnmarkense]MCD8405115.1 ATP-dependent Clp protease adaptor ClpS [Tenacibaculum dicentrarchi]MBE7644568.1 ATP-dependent Clp protease adaptor ClpS [Tenacibaculum finnmarkense genomovar ulcerans]MBE7648805.1 ATP-dependent Clp protease adaptor ClpS [Tenacibaculum finnmarkense genomovar ulcerans]MBE7659264.1 ATP-dependent Clp protease adaptor ClpS [Tenacibaculum finnmarkense genomovar finnmarkense]MBE7687840.1 ATP-dependent Clp protease ad
MSTIEKIQEDLDVLTQETKKHEIILHNDDVNSFDFVIDSLVDVCDHTLEQAEQCSVLVHYKGKCAVKTGEYKDLEPRCAKLLQLGLSAEII